MLPVLSMRRPSRVKRGYTTRSTTQRLARGRSMLSEKTKKDILTEELLRKMQNKRTAPEVAELAEKEPLSLEAFLEDALSHTSLTQAQVIKKAEINETFGWQIFHGQRHASKDNLLKIAFALGLSGKETNRLLAAGEVPALYIKNRRDAILYFALDHGYSIMEANDALYRLSEDILS